MKLYANIKSERATKGQGGNKYINIDMAVGSADESLKILEGTLEAVDGGYKLYVTTLGQGEENQCIDIFIKDSKCITNWAGYCSSHKVVHKGKKQKTAKVCGYSGEEFPCNVCPKDGHGNCTTA